MSQIETTKWNTIKTDVATLLTNRPGVFAAGDVIRGPNTVINAIADGKKAAVMIDRYIRGVELTGKGEPRLPEFYIAPSSAAAERSTSLANRAELQRAPADWRKRNFAEVEVSFSIDEAACEAGRCLRCDLEFSQCNKKQDNNKVTSGVKVS